MTVSVLVAAILLAVAAIVVNRLEAYFREQEERALEGRALVTGQFVALVGSSIGSRGVEAPNTVASGLEAVLRAPEFSLLMDAVARADVRIEIGGVSTTSSQAILTPADNGIFTYALASDPQRGEARDPELRGSQLVVVRDNAVGAPWGVKVTLSNPYTTRANTLATITQLIGATALGALLAAVILVAVIAGRFTRPLRRLTETTRRLAGGDLSGRVPATEIGASYAEVRELTDQFNVMAGRLQESIELVRRDRDRSRDFLADVSHELRTPIAALRMFNELLREGAWRDDPAREEFLESSRVQLERLDWLAQNLLELSKLESGLLALDLRPDDLRTAVESAVEQAEPQARRRGVDVTLDLAPNPIRVRHDPQRIGQVVGNLVGNAIKFTPRGGRVTVTVRPHRDGARLEVRDTGSGIDAAELPHIFERFYRGSSANEARSSGSGLGLAIARSIVDMHGGRIDVESRVGAGSTFTVTLVRDPRATGTDHGGLGGAPAGNERGTGAASPPSAEHGSPAERT